MSAVEVRRGQTYSDADQVYLRINTIVTRLPREEALALHRNLGTALNIPTPEGLARAAYELVQCCPVLSYKDAAELLASARKELNQ